MSGNFMGFGPTPANQTLAQNGDAGPIQTQTVAPAVLAPGTTSIQTGAAQPFTNSQLGLLQSLGAQAAGTGGPTLAQQQLTSGTNQTLASALAAGSSSQRMGANPGADTKAILDAQAGANATGAAAAANTRAGEQQAAQQQLAGVANTGAQQQLQEAQAQEAATQGGAEFNAANTMTAGEFNAGSANAAAQAYANQLAGITATTQQQQNQLFNQAVGNILPSNPLSDETVKTAISNEASTANEFLSALGSYMNPEPAQALAPLTSGGSTSGQNAMISGLKAAAKVPAGMAPGAGAAGAAPGAGAAGAGMDAGVGGDVVSAAGGTAAGAAGAAGGAAGADAALMLSDENEKMDMEGSTTSYKYKPEAAAAGATGEFPADHRFAGPTAQDLLRSGPMGASTVVKGPDGVLRVDTQRLTLALASALGVQQGHVRRLEEALAEKHGRAKSKD